MATAFISLLTCIAFLGIVWCIDYYRQHRKPTHR